MFPPLCSPRPRWPIPVVSRNHNRGWAIAIFSGSPPIVGPSSANNRAAIRVRSMAIRIRFKPAEREAFVVGAEIEWLDSTSWRSGVVTGEIRWDMGLPGSRGGYQVLPIRDTGPTTRTITTGREYAINAGHVRLATPAVTVAVDPGKTTGVAIQPTVE